MLGIERSDRTALVAFQSALDRRREAGNGESVAISAMLDQQRQRLGEVFGADERHAGIDAAGMLEIEPARAARLDRVLNHRHRRRDVVGKFGRAAERHLGAEIPGNRGDFIVVGGHDHTGNRLACLGRLDCVADHRLACEALDILARDPLRSAACRDDRDIV